MSGKKRMKVSGEGTGKSGGTNPRRRKPRCFEPEYGISRWAIQCRLKEPVQPKTRGNKSAKTLAAYKGENKRLKIENELMRDFLRSIERK